MPARQAESISPPAFSNRRFPSPNRQGRLKRRWMASTRRTQGRRKRKHNLKDQMLVLAPHEGIVPSETWLACRKKLMNNMKIQSARKATHTWLAGKIKCGNCGYALMSIVNRVGRQYLRCTKRLDNKSCVGCGKIYTAELETVVYQQMVKKLESHKILTGGKKAAKANPKIRRPASGTCPCGRRD